VSAVSEVCSDDGGEVATHWPPVLLVSPATGDAAVRAAATARLGELMRGGHGSEPSAVHACPMAVPIDGRPVRARLYLVLRATIEANGDGAAAGAADEGRLGWGCPFDGARFPCWQALRSHTEAEHGVARFFLCGLCDADGTYGSPMELPEHVAADHHDERVLLCVGCDSLGHATLHEWLRHRCGADRTRG